jgi:AraC family transcriptional regulator, regulatory protein of adaptative response / methylated-DNA-[protein]-cysteine methyltransferase
MLPIMSDEIKYWQAVKTKDASYDGQFFYGVLTTKVFCRPGCAARMPLRENVRFYKTSAEAAADGLRPCKRCKPLDVRPGAAQDVIRRACVYIRRNLENRDALKLDAISQNAGFSPYHFQRSFKSAMGVTPRQYAEGLRMETLKEDLRTGPSVTDAIYSAGFNSSSRVYDRAAASLGMTPKQYRTGGAAVEISHVTVKTPLGPVMIGATDRGLCFLQFGESGSELLEALRQEFPAATLIPMPKPYSNDFNLWMEGLISFLAGEAKLAPTPVDLHGTAFQLKVWRYLQTIPAGSLQSYAEVAQGIGQPKAFRAVASACAANRVAVVVPCHRVIRGDGGLGGYRWGIERKRTILETERTAS